MLIAPPPKTDNPELDAWLQQVYLKLTQVPIVSLTAPSTSSSTAVQGDLIITSTYLYVADDTDSWVRVALSSF